MPTEPVCPCCSGNAFDACCAPILSGRPATTALELMRSRYAAYVRGAIDYVVSTHDAATRASVDRTAAARWSKDTLWMGLEIVATERGSVRDSDGIVEFIARGVTKGVPFAQHERSKFRKLDDRWYYVDGVARTTAK